MPIQYIRLFVCLCFLSFLSCKSSKFVPFPNLVDTTDKPITKQIKKTYVLPSLGLYLDNQFDAARLNGVKQKNDSTIVVYIAPENTPINNSSYYAFDIWSIKKDSIYISFEYPDGYTHRYTPKIRQNGNWSVLNEKYITEVDKLVTVKVGVSPNKTTIAAQELFTSSDTYKWIDQISKGKPHVREYSAGTSRAGRNIPVLDIYNGSKKRKPLIILMTRQHPPEVTGLYAYQKFLTTLLSDTPSNKELFDNYRVLAFPLLNPDGVDEGHWRHNLGGIDLNRDWSVYNQKEVRQVVDYILKTSKKDKCPILLGLDFHSTYEDIFYTNRSRAGTTMPSFIDDWFKALEANIDGYTVNEAANDSSRPVSKGWFLYGHKAVGITYEIGDSTPYDQIMLFGKVSAEQMVHLLNQRNKNSN